MYHISDIKKFIKCERLYFYGLAQDNTFKPYLRSDESTTDLLIRHFHIDNYFEGQRNDETSLFFVNEDKYDWFVRPRFADDELRVNIPLMHKTKKGYVLYFLVYGTMIKEPDLLNYSICIKVLQKLGLKIYDLYLVYFNGQYVNQGEIDPDKLFISTNTHKDRSIYDLAVEYDFDYEGIIEKISKTSLADYRPERTRFCKLNGICDHYAKCFPDEEKLEDDSILHLVSSANKNIMYENGIRKLKDADLSLVEGNKVQYAQIMASKNGGLFMDELLLKQFMKKLDSRPISFVDFEWDRYLVPPYYGMKPTDVVCFEYAMYNLDENDEVSHFTYVGTGDCRKAFLEGLIEHLPESGPIVAYNAIGAEVLRLKELAAVYSEYKEKVEDICSRFVDLAIPFVEGMIYDTAMAGNFTLKKLVDICSDYSYKNLDIDNGMLAVYSWRDIDKGLSDEKKVIDDLKQYCSLDAYGLILVYKWLKRLLTE